MNDAFVANAPFSVDVTSGANGTTSKDNNVVTYTPDQDFNGTDSFSYTIVQGDKSATAVVSITIEAVNDAPTIGNTIFSIDENKTAVATISVSDVDKEDTLVLTMVSESTDAGSFSLSDQRELSFKVAPDYEVSSTTYSLTVSVTDGIEVVEKAVTVEVTDVDEPPVFSSSGPYSAQENQQEIIGTFSASDPENKDLTYSLGGNDAASLTLSTAGVISFAVAPNYEVKNTITEAILKLDELAKILRKKRMKDGAISFDKVEVKFNLDKDNNPEGVYFKESKDANKLIEEFMLLANRSVAEFIGKQNPKKTFIYRIHDEPNDEKIAALENIIKQFGYKLDTRDRKSTSNSLNNLLKEVQGKKEQNLVDSLAIRSMSKAVYTTQNIGHYGLAFDYYTHFTSPIRRYPDIMVHRLLNSYLEEAKIANEDQYEQKCRHSSEMEGLASQAERASIKYMQVKYMSDHQNQNFLGVISGVTDWGIYVEIISNKCEGMVRLQDIKGDHYVFNKEEYAAIGDRTKTSYQLGDEIYVRVKKADLVRKQLDFDLLGHKEDVLVN
jgi:VCBS repeat-containing protein